jgi:hypothetical protein
MGSSSRRSSSACTRLSWSAPGAGTASPGWSMISRSAIQACRPCLSGFQAARGNSTGTGPPGSRRARRSSSSRTSSMVLPAPGSPSTTSRPVGTPASTAARFPPWPASPAGAAAQRVRLGGSPGQLCALVVIAVQSSTMSALAGTQAIGSAWGSLSRRWAASASHCTWTATASWSAISASDRSPAPAAACCDRTVSTAVATASSTTAPHTSHRLCAHAQVSGMRSVAMLTTTADRLVTKARLAASRAGRRAAGRDRACLGMGAESSHQRRLVCEPPRYPRITRTNTRSVRVSARAQPRQADSAGPPRVDPLRQQTSRLFRNN